MRKAKPLFAQLSLLGVGFFLTLLLVRDFSVRTANAIANDHPAVYARLFENPSSYGCTETTRCGYTWALASLPNWLTYFLLHFAGISPEIPAALIVILQNVLTAWALYLYAQGMSEKRWLPWCVALCTFVAEPWRWNLAYYPSVMFSPYPGHLVMPALILAGICVLKNRWVLMELFLFIAALIHPSLALQMAFLCFVFNWLSQEETKTKWKVTGILAFTLVPAVLPLRLLGVLSTETLPKDVLMPAILANPHFVPWNMPVVWQWALPTLLGILILAVWGSRKLSPLYQRFVAANLLTLIVLGVVHFLGVEFQIVKIIQLCPLRSSVFVLLFLTPIAFAFLFELCLSESRLTRGTAAALILFQTWFSYGFFWSLIAALFCSIKGKRGTSLFVLGLSLLFFLAAGRIFRVFDLVQLGNGIRYFLAPGFAFYSNKTLLLALMATAIFSVLSHEKARRWFLISVLLSVAVFKAWQTGEETQTGFPRDLSLAQHWAQQNTPLDAAFIIPAVPWLGVSQRRAISADRNRLGYNVYTGDVGSKRQVDAIESFYKDVNKDSYSELDANVLQLFQKRFGGDFVVRQAGDPVALPEVYKNQSLIIYRIKE